MARHTFTHAKDLFRGKSFVQGHTPEGGVQGQRGIPAMIPVRYTIANQSGSAVVASSDSAFMSVGSASALTMTTTTMTGNGKTNGRYAFARVLSYAVTTAQTEVLSTIVGEDIYGGTISEVLNFTSATQKFSKKAFAVIHSFSYGSGQESGAVLGHSGGFGLPYRLNSHQDVLSVHVLASGQSAVLPGPATAVPATFQAIQANSTAGTIDGLDERGVIHLVADAIDGSGIANVWFYVADTDKAHGHSYGDGSGT